MDVELTIGARMAGMNGDFLEPWQQIFYTPETPLSPLDSDSCSSSPGLDENSFSKSIFEVDSTCDLELDIEVESEIERLLQAEDAVMDEVVAAAVKLIENLDADFSENDCCITLRLKKPMLLPKCEEDQAEDSFQLREDEYIVREILQRRLVKKKSRGRAPTEEDYEYLVAWEGYGDEDNTWEPFEHLKHCSTLLDHFHDRLRTTALRKRKGKRF